jgi:hypothetical protein
LLRPFSSRVCTPCQASAKSSRNPKFGRVSFGIRCRSTGETGSFYYRPTLEWAYTDILALRDIYSLGIMREIHRWAAHAMVITVWLHMYRVFLTGSYKPPREFNWVVGVILLLLTLAAVGPARGVGDHGRLEHGPGHSVFGA